MRILSTEYTDYLVNPEEYHLPLLLKRHLFNEINEHFFSDKQLGLVKPDHVLTIDITTTVKQLDLEITGPEYKKNEFVWSIKFPYQTIHDSSDRNKTYTELFFRGLKTILAHYRVSEQAVDAIREKVIAEITGNTKYDLQQEELNNAHYVRESRAEYKNKKE